jgi:hypothetical protein
MLEVLMPSCSELQTAEIGGTGLWIQRVLCSSEELAVHIATTTPVSTCPVCQFDATRVHSRYRRTLFDLPQA